MATSTRPSESRDCAAISAPAKPQDRPKASASNKRDPRTRFMLNLKTFPLLCRLYRHAGSQRLPIGGAQRHLGIVWQTMDFGLGEVRNTHLHLLLPQLSVHNLKHPRRAIHANGLARHDQDIAVFGGYDGHI